MKKLSLMTIIALWAVAIPAVAKLATYEEWLTFLEKCTANPDCSSIVTKVKVQYGGESLDGWQLRTPTASTTYFYSENLRASGWYLCWYDNLVEVSPKITCVAL